MFVSTFYIKITSGGEKATLDLQKEADRFSWPLQWKLIVFCNQKIISQCREWRALTGPPAAHWGSVTIIRIGTFKHALSDQGVQTRLSQFGVWGYATAKKKVIHHQGLKGSVLKALSPSKSITINQSLLEGAMTYCHLWPRGLKWGHLKPIVEMKSQLCDLCPLLLMTALKSFKYPCSVFHVGIIVFL